MKKIGLIIIILSLTFMVNAGSTDVIKKRFPVTGDQPARLFFKDIDGDVVIKSHDRPEFVFEFSKELRGSKSERNLELFEKIHPQMEYSNNTLKIEIKYPYRRFNIFNIFGSPRIRIKSVLLVPKELDLNLRVIDGDIEVSKISGDLDLKSVDGDCTLRLCDGNIKIRSTDGDINAFNLSGDMGLRSVDGDIDVKGFTGKIKVHAIDGDIVLTRGKGTLKAHTTDGDIKARGAFTEVDASGVDGNLNIYFENGSGLTGDSSFRTSDGDISLHIPSDFSFRIEARAIDGRITTGDLEFKRVEYKSKHRLEAEVGESNNLWTIKTRDGDITLREN